MWKILQEKAPPRYLYALISRTLESFGRQFHATVTVLKSMKNSSSALNNQQNFALQNVNKIHRRHTRTLSVEDSTLVPVSEIKKFLLSHKINYEQGYTSLITTCPKFTKHQLKLTELDRMYINTTTGFFMCHSCRKCGPWSQLKQNIELIISGNKPARGPGSLCFFDAEEEDVTLSECKSARDLYEAGSCFSDNKYGESIKNQLGIEQLSDTSLDKHRVHISENGQSLLFPLFGLDKTVQGVKDYTLSSDDGQTCIREKSIPKHDVKGLFGWNTITKAVSTVVITATDLDAVAVNQAAKVMALALPRGTTSLPQEVLPMLEQFKRIILWFGNDIRCWEAMKHFAHKLGGKRCSLVSPSELQPSPLAALKQGMDIGRIIKQAKPVGHAAITSFRELREEVLNELSHAEQVSGVKWKRYPQLNEILKGHRTGELTVFTGPTGCGKTTFISDYSLDLCLQGVNTLWGSFEINNVRLMKMMLQQFAQKNLSKHLDEYDYWADRFEQLPMYFMTFHGSETLRTVTETMSHAVYVHDISHVIVDNLQFMMGVEADRMYADRFLRQDQLISSFRKFATNMNCHVTLVIHPRKERDNDELSTSSIFGSAKASQEADNILILQDTRLKSARGKKYIQITKNRFDGELGLMPLIFDKESLSFASRIQEVNTASDEN